MCAEPSPSPATVSSPRPTSFSCASLPGCHFSAAFLFPSIFFDPREWKVPYPRSGAGDLPWAEGVMYCLEVFNFLFIQGAKSYDLFSLSCLANVQIPFPFVLKVYCEHLAFPSKLSQGRRSDSRYRIILNMLSLFIPFFCFSRGLLTVFHWVPDDVAARNSRPDSIQ